MAAGGASSNYDISRLSKLENEFPPGFDRTQTMPVATLGPAADTFSTLGVGEIIAINPSARVLMCSALGQESKVIESIKLVARDFVVKPFQPTRLLDAVGKALA